MRILAGGYTRPLLLMALFACSDAAVAAAQSPQTSAHERARPYLSLALSYDGAVSNLTTQSRFGLQGGGLEASGTCAHGLGVTASVLGLHSGNSGGGVPVNLLLATFGPRYSLTKSLHTRPVTVFAQGLVGEANGFRGLYPNAAGPMQSASSLATQVGGGVEVKVSERLWVRVIEADWVRTQLPNATTGVQNNLRLATGIVLRSRTAAR